MANFLKSLFVKGVEIDTTGASTGNVLSYNGTKFAPAAPGSGSLALDDLSDVVVTSPEEFQGLSYNGTSWVNSHIPLVSYVRNAESTTITTGTCVYLFGATGDHATVKRADNSNDTTSSKTIGVAGADITTSNEGPIVTRGYVDGIDLSVGYTAGDVLWLGENGAFTTTKPTAPDHLVFIGVVVRATNNGIIYVATQNGYELDELHNVSLPSPNSGEFLKYNGSLWVADAIDLGTDTTGNYMSGASAGTGISVSHTPGEGSTATISVDAAYSGFSPIGSVQMYAGSTAPTGWAICNGSELAIASFGDLYAVIGTRYGSLTNGSGGAGTSHFRLPSFGSRVPKGITSGTPTVPTTVSTGSASSVDTHTHSVNSSFTAGGVNSSFTAGGVNSSFTAGGVNSSFTAGNASSHNHPLSGSTTNESTLHYHFWNGNVTTGGQNVDHSHGYFKPNSGANNNTGGANSGHTHNFNLTVGTGFQVASDGNANAYHVHYLSNAGGRTGANAVADGNSTTTVNSTFSAGNVNSSFTAGNVNSSFTAGNVNSSFTAGNASSINSSTASHTHTSDAVDIVFIIRVS
jgi:microcystin-dependent protein